MEASILDIAKSSFSEVCCKPLLFLFVVVVLLLGENSICCNGGRFATSFGADSIGFTNSFGADSILYTQEELYEVKN